MHGETLKFLRMFGIVMGPTYLFKTKLSQVINRA